MSGIFPPTPARSLRRWIVGVPLGLITLGYGGAIGYLRLNETKLIYHPSRTVTEPAPDLHAEVVRVRTPDSLSVVAWVMPPAQADSGSFWIIFCHGNGGNISSRSSQDLARGLLAQGVGVVFFDYRGYGASDDGPLDEEGLYRDARAVYDWMLDRRGIAPSRIVIVGHSLGSGVATHLAARVEAAGLVLWAALSSVPDVGARSYPWMPVQLIASERFASIDRIDSIAMPKLHLHASDDTQIPLEFGERLFAAAPAPKEFVTLTGGHNNAFRADSATYFGALRRWLTALGAEDRESPAPTTVPPAAAGSR